VRRSRWWNDGSLRTDAFKRNAQALASIEAVAERRNLFSAAEADIVFPIF
jgi:hypothetical protein